MTVAIVKSIYDPKSRDDGLRVLVSTYWPRGVTKCKVDLWLKDLGTDPQLIKAWKSGKLAWSEFKKKYVADLKDSQKQETIKDLAKRTKTQKITLLCGCRDANRCHRAILKEQIERINK